MVMRSRACCEPRVRPHVHAFAFVLEGIELSAVRAEGGWLEVQKRYSRRALK